jgi:diacylglycerol O-acyltransferase
MPDRDALTGTDNAWRRMGTTDNLTTITGVLWFDERLPYRELCDRLEERLLRFDRFEQHVGSRKRSVRQPYWETEAEFDIETHVYHVSLPEPQDKATFQSFVGDLMSRPLDERRPLWEAYLVDGAGSGDGNAVAFRINHSLGDGFALMYVLFGLVDNPDEIEMPMGIVPDPPSVDEFEEEPVANGGAELEEPDRPAPSTGDGRGATDTEADADEKVQPDIKPDGPLETLKLGAKAAKTAWGLLTQEEETETSLRGELGTAKRAGWTDEMDLQKVKDISDAHDATLNDVLLAALAGAFRRLLQDRGEDVDGRELRVTVPVNLKPMDERDASLGNYFGLVFLPLPIGTPELDERIELVHERMDAERAGIEAYLMYLILAFGGRAPDSVQRWLMDVFEDRATGVVTNVPGPLQAVEFAGREITDFMFWVPQGVDQGIGISIFSYDGSVKLGIAGDARLLGDPDDLASAFRSEIAALLDGIE